MAIYVRDLGYTDGPGVNPHWNVTMGLAELQGVMKGAILLLEEADRHIALRDRGVRPLPDIIGIVMSATMVTAYATEIALKTLIAQTKPTRKPPNSHNLLHLFDQLDHDTQDMVQNTYNVMAPIGQPDWRDSSGNLREIILAGCDNFLEWRYLAEKKSASDGIPKALINVTEAARLVTLKLIAEPNRLQRKTKSGSEVM
jgi:hypothetical protein